MRRYKITVSLENKAAGIFSDKRVTWVVVDTVTGKQSGRYDTARDAAKVADKLEIKR